MTKADDSGALRVGGWTPPHGPAGTEHARTTTGPGAHPSGGRPHRRSGRAPLVLVAATGLAVLGYGIAAVVVLGDETPAPERALPGAQWSPAPGAPPVSMLPAPPTAAAPPPREIRKVGVEKTTRPRHGSTAPGRTAGSAPTPDPAFTVGRAVGVGVVGATGYRLSGRDFVARIEADRAVAGLSGRFVVRPGLADARCVSFESAEHPGFHLRHRDWVLLVEQAEPTGLYRADATFCPVASGGGFALRSVNYPDHHLIRTGGLVRLVRTTPAQASAFRALPPI